MASKRRRRIVFVSRLLPWAMLFFCATNWFWGTRGWWWIELGASGVTYYTDQLWRGYHYTHAVKKGLYSYDGCLFFSRAFDYRPLCQPGLREPFCKDARVWSSGPQFGAI